MTTYRVILTNTCSAVVEVEADSPEEAAEMVYDVDGMPGSLTVGAFGSNSENVDEGQWEVESVYLGNKQVN
jgi:hypothetical protein